MLRALTLGVLFGLLGCADSGTTRDSGDAGAADRMHVEGPVTHKIHDLAQPEPWNPYDAGVDAAGQ